MTGRGKGEEGWRNEGNIHEEQVSERERFGEVANGRKEGTLLGEEVFWDVEGK